MIDSPFLWDAIARRAAATPDALFARDERGTEMDFAGFRDACERRAAGLQRLGIGAESRVSWQLPTGFDALVLCGALARLGAIQNPVLPMLRERELRFITRQIDTGDLFVPRSYRGFDYAAMAGAVAAEGSGLRVHVTDDGLPDGDPAMLPAAPSPCDPPDAPVRWILYSSGTTADPKGVRHADPSVARPGFAMAEVLAMTPDDRHAFVFPLTHVGGINWLFAGLAVGFAHLLVETFDPPRTIPFLAEHGVTVAGAGTVFHQAYLAAQEASGATPIFPGVRAFPGGGAPKPPQLFADLKARTGAPIVSGYGLTEHPIAVMGRVDDPDDALAHTEGRATPGTEIRIVAGDGRVLPAGEEGEVRLRGPHLFRGYVDASLDAHAFDEDGFLRSGDLGRRDADGFLTITGRLKDVIIRKGENISAKELEDHLHEHPAIVEVAVVGVPDDARGERVCAVVVGRQDAAAPDLGGIGRFLSERGLARQKLPEQLAFRDALPRNASGKVLKNQLREELTVEGAPALG